MVKVSTELYLSEGKQAFRQLLADVAVSDGLRTVGTFYGTGIDTRLFASRGLTVTAAETVRALWPAMTADAEEHGFRAFHGNAVRLTEHQDMFHADFIGNASPHAFRTLRSIAAVTDRWLAVTLATDHQLDPSMQGEAALFTVPAWMTGASGFTLEYFARYVRNRGGQTMFVAILSRASGKGAWHPVQTTQIAYSVRDRGYWASRRLYETALLPHRYAPRNEREKASDTDRYWANRDHYLARSRVSYEKRKANPERIAADRASTRRWRASEKGRAWGRANARAIRLDPERGAKLREYQREYHRAWSARKKALAVQSTASEALPKAA